MRNRTLVWCGLLLASWVSAGIGSEAQIREQLLRSQTRYSTAKAWQARREQLRENFLLGAGLWPLPDRPPVRVVRHSHREYGDYSVENVALETLPGFYCTGNLYRPVGGKDLEPAILSPHGHFRPLGRYRESQQIRCAHLARMGATVFSYSMVGWQDNTQTSHDDPLVLALQTWNSLRVVDFLTGLERVDPERVGISGASGGGTQTFFLTLIDERVKASAPLVIVYPWTAPQGCLCEGGLPIMQASSTNAIELAAAAAPRPQLLISVGNDPTSNFPNFGFPFMQQMYEVAGAKQNVRNVHFTDEGHDFGPSKRDKVYRFFQEHLQLRPDGFSADSKLPQATHLREDLKRITLEAPEKLAVFNETHPRPPGSIAGSAAVAHAFRDHLQELRTTAQARSLATHLEQPLLEYGFKTANAEDEALLFTASGFSHVGLPQTAQGSRLADLAIRVLDDRGIPVPCRINVVGSDGHFYEPASSKLKKFSLTGVWPRTGWGNRRGKAPIRYLGRFFYSEGESEVRVPAGLTRIEIWKGFEYRPVTTTVDLAPGCRRTVTARLESTGDVTAFGYWSGDPHIHIQRRSREDEDQILDLMEAENIHYSTLLAYNEPAGPYAGFMDQMDSPQLHGVGKRSVVTRGGYTLLSGQEYRSSTYGHMNVFGLDQLVLQGRSLNANNWPPFGHVARQARDAGGVAFYAHGGYAQEIYADVPLGNIDGVELLQFGVYRGIGLTDWYHMLNSGYRVPANGASDYPACRKLGDCQTFIYHPPEDGAPTMQTWLQRMAEGRSFFTTGPLLLLEVNQQPPGSEVAFDSAGPHELRVSLRVRSEVAPVTHIQILANGRVIHETEVDPQSGQASWLDIEREFTTDRSVWLAARAFSLSRTGSPDAESHTNPVYVTVAGTKIYEQDSLDVLVTRVDEQIARHKERDFPEQSRIINYFESARDALLKRRAAEGQAPRKAVSTRSDLQDFDPGKRSHTAEELRAFLQPVPPKPLDEVVQTFETADDFELQLVASEPLIHDPVCGAFDADGKLYVGEMLDYPYKPAQGQKPQGTVRLLQDTDGDGTFDRSTVFAEHLLWVGGIAPWKGGVYVAAAPDIWYLKDHDGDGRADERRRVVTGFGTGNQQAMLNNLTWGLDHQIYGSTAGNGGRLEHVDSVSTKRRPLTVTGRDFRWNPSEEDFEATTGTVQFGNTFDDWGNRFLCSESRPLLHAVLPHRYLARNPYLPVPSGLKHLTDGPVRVFRISPLERWRIIRSSRRIAHGARSSTSAGASHHVIDAGAGVTVYRGGAYPPQYYGDIFIGGAQNNLVHRRKLKPEGLTFQSQRVERQTEFVRSSDNWFRPVNFVNAPDGTLYVLDMHREILETIHVPLDVTRFLDFTSGRDRGRIYRIAPRSFETSPPPKLSAASTSELIAALESPHGWWRDTAHRLLYERQDAAAVPMLREKLHSSVPRTRLLALWSLHGLSQLRPPDLLLALADQDSRLREHAVRLSEPHLDRSHEVLDLVVRLASDDSPRVRTQVAFSLGESTSKEAATCLAGLAASSNLTPELRTAILSSANDSSSELWLQLLTQKRSTRTPQTRSWLLQIGEVLGARNRSREISSAVAALAQAPDRILDTGLLQAIGRGLRRNGAFLTEQELTDPKVAEYLEQTVTQALAAVANEQRTETARTSAIQLLTCFPFDTSGPQLIELLRTTSSPALRRTVLQELAVYSDDSVSEAILQSWKSLSPEQKSAAMKTLLQRNNWTTALLQAARSNPGLVSSLTTSERERLSQHANKEIRGLASELFGSPPSDRTALIKRYRSVAGLTGDIARGKNVFQQHCGACHKLGAHGTEVGPDLSNSGARDVTTILTHILDPNRYFLPQYETFLVVDSNGRSWTGRIAAQTATSIILQAADGKSNTLLRANVESLSGTGQSLMPEGFEQKINLNEMADLIGFLQANQPKSAAPTLDIGTLPGLTEPAEEAQ